MADAFIYDHVRTPRGRGKPDGALHEITPIQLAAQTLDALRRRTELDTALVDDVVLGCVSPVGEQGGNIARVAALVAGYAQTVAGQQLNRFCASGLEAVNNAAAQVMSGQSDAVVAGGVESMSRVPMGSDGTAWASDPAVAWQTFVVPQGIGADLIATLDGFSRSDVDAFAAESQRRAAQAWNAGWFSRSVTPVRDVLGEIGMSGNAEFPHVEFVVRYNSVALDPFVGVAEFQDCKGDRAPLWSEATLAALPYRPTGPLAAGFASEQPNPTRAREGHYREAELPVMAPVLVLWAESFGVLKGDVERFEIIGPGQDRILRNERRIETDYVSWFSFGGLKRPASGWAEGQYQGTYTVTRAGKEILSMTRSVMLVKTQ